MKLKTRVSTVHLLAWIKVKIMTISSVGEDVEKLEFSYIVGVDVK